MDELVHDIYQIGEWADSCYKRADLLEYNTLMNLGIEAGNHIRKLSILCTGMVTPDEADIIHKGFPLHEAVIVGHLVRIYKIFDQLVYQVAENKGEIASIFARLLFETYAHMKYFIIRGKDSIDSYIKCSFKAAVKHYQFIKAFEKERELSGIEKRIIRKIENRARLVNLNIEDLIANKNWKVDGKNFSDILLYLEQNDMDEFKWSMGYSFLFANGSSFVHGTWYDVQVNHLEENNGRFLPKYSYDAVDPRYILPSSLIPVNACRDFLRWRNTDPDEFVLGVLKKLYDLLVYLDEMDEIRLDKRDGLLD